MLWIIQKKDFLQYKTVLLKDDEKVYQVKGHGNINFEVVMTTSCT